ncbi:MAG: flagellar motor protein MotB [Deltaproteobacteria bacterium]|jgi:chemotaxis protein MotB|nr:flagellar motor protein MotB [Deltaproteobacteria bacterium]
MKHEESESSEVDITDLSSDHGHGGGGDHDESNWLISYADLMTLLVGFFVILLSFSKVDQDEFEKAKQSLSKQFGGNYQKPFADIADKIKNAIDKINAGNQVEIKTNETGVNISFIGTVFFSSGSVDFKNEAKNILNQILPIIKQEASDFGIVIEGHTDDVPLSAGGTYKNNWELSSIRACRVLEYMITFGFSSENVVAVGYGEARPVVPNRDENGIPNPINQSQNRRVIIKLIKNGAQTI